MLLGGGGRAQRKQVLDLRESEGAILWCICLCLRSLMLVMGCLVLLVLHPVVPGGLRGLPADPEPASGAARRLSGGAGWKSAADCPALGHRTPCRVTSQGLVPVNFSGMWRRKQKTWRTPPSLLPCASDVIAHLNCTKLDCQSTALSGSFCFVCLYKGHDRLTEEVDGPDNCSLQELPWALSVGCLAESLAPTLWLLGALRLLPGCNPMNVSRHCDCLPV